MTLAPLQPILMHKLSLAFLFSNLLFLTHCTLYKMDVQQGNLITQDMLDRLEWHMPAKKVSFIMGTPLIRDAFHAQRWDYFYSHQTVGKAPQQRKITLLFDDQERLTGIEGDVVTNLNKKPSTPDSQYKEEIPIL